MISIDNKYEFIPPNGSQSSEIGFGSFSKVYLARNRYTQQIVAIKVMEISFGLQNGCLDTLENEILIHSKLVHPNIIQYIEYIKTPQHICVVQEYAQNGNLYNLLFQQKKFNEVQAKKYFIQACQAIRHVHSSGFMYRDLKPENLLIDGNQNIKLCDFGYCIKSQTIYDPKDCGTYEYMAPELYFKQPYDSRVDIWGLGILLYEMLHGTPPFQCQSEIQVIQQLQQFRLQLDSSLSLEAQDLITNILQIEPHKRFTIDQILLHPWFQQTFPQKHIMLSFSRTLPVIQTIKNTQNNDNVKIKYSNRQPAPINTKSLTEYYHDSQSPLKIQGSLQYNTYSPMPKNNSSMFAHIKTYTPLLQTSARKHNTIDNYQIHTPQKQTLQNQVSVESNQSAQVSSTSSSQLETNNHFTFSNSKPIDSQLSEQLQQSLLQKLIKASRTSSDKQA